MNEGDCLTACIQLENVQLWQLALVGAALTGLQDGRVHIGARRTRGLNRFGVRNLKLCWRQGSSDERLYGSAELCGPERVRWYGLLTPDATDGVPPGAVPLRDPRGWAWSWSSEAALAMLQSIGDASWPRLRAYAGGQA